MWGLPGGDFLVEGPLNFGASLSTKSSEGQLGACRRWGEHPFTLETVSQIPPSVFELGPVSPNPFN